MEKRLSEDIHKHVEYVNVRIRSSDQISLQPIIRRYRVLYSEIKWFHGHPVAGDMGSPVVCHRYIKPTQYGIISDYYNNLHRKTSITVYEPVERYMNFIRSLVPLQQESGQKKEMVQSTLKPTVRAGSEKCFYKYLLIVVPVCFSSFVRINKFFILLYISVLIFYNNK